MRIIFGWYSFTLKTYTPADLKIEEPIDSGISFETRQKCAHLFFIPCFSLGKMHVIRKNDKLYDCPATYVQRIIDTGRVRTPWYSFTFPLLLVFVYMGLAFHGMAKDRTRNKMAEQNFALNVERTDYALDHLSRHHFIKLKSTIKDYQSPDIFLKVDKVTGDHLNCLLLKSKKSHRDLTAYTLLKSLQTYQGDTLQLSRAELKKAVPRDFSRFLNRNPEGVDLLKNDSLYYVETITYLDGPEIIHGGMSAQFPQMLDLKFKNVGLGGKIVEIKTEKGNIEWFDNSPNYIPGGYSTANHFLIRGTGTNKDVPYKFLLLMEDSLGGKHTFSVTGKNSDRVVERVM